MFCDDLEGRDGKGVEGSCKKQEIYVYVYLIHFNVPRKLTVHCKAIIFQ